MNSLNVRNCKPMKTLVFTKGGLKKIENILTGDEVLTSVGFFRVIETFYQGIQSIVQIKTNIGISICTPEHRMAVLDSPNTYIWKKTNDLLNTDYLVFLPISIEGSFTSLPLFNYINSSGERNLTPELTEDILWFLGYISINCKTENGEFSITNTNLEILNKCISIISIFDNNSNTVYVDEIIGITDIRITISNVDICNYFSIFTGTVVNSCILESTISFRCSYLAGIFDSCKINHSYDKNYEPFVVVKSESDYFITQIQSLYSSLGIPTRKCNYNHNFYTLHIIGIYSCKTWERLISCYSMTFTKTTEFIKCVNITDDYCFPRNWLNSSLNRPTGGGAPVPLINDDFISIDEYEEEYGSYPLYIPVKVESISTINHSEPVYNLSIENKHEYLCGEGLLNHSCN